MRTPCVKLAEATAIDDSGGSDKHKTRNMAVAGLTGVVAGAAAAAGLVPWLGFRLLHPCLGPKDVGNRPPNPELRIRPLEIEIIDRKIHYVAILDLDRFSLDYLVLGLEGTDARSVRSVADHLSLAQRVL
ncbi:hypothetical protein K449DRAFT_436225 [Hypoxylon sp. EC38]|nr:hypothetical protein K449DRAFT_436225 [Hypoxylon sp. EC38]